MESQQSKEPRHRKLGEVVDSNVPDFKLRLRMPHWAPDEVSHPQGAAPEKNETIYVEEALKAARDSAGGIGRDAFQPPLTDTGGDWVLGAKSWSPKSGSAFDRWLEEICSMARRHNVALYRLRKLHLEVESHGTMEPLPDEPTSPSPEEAEILYQAAVVELRRHLEKRTDDGKPRVVDMVQVNGYIVSVRAVDGIFDGLPASGSASILGPQPGGSDSSHIYLSSPFCSSC